jgi:hypothetical protein
MVAAAEGAHLWEGSLQHAQVVQVLMLRAVVTAVLLLTLQRM